VRVPDTLWATDTTEGWTEEGRRAVFVMIDHASGEAWADAGLRMDCFAAADLLREVCSERFGSVEQAVASGLSPRYDGGPCFRSEHYQLEIDQPRDRTLTGLPLRAGDERQIPVIRLGNGPRPRLRFDPAALREHLSGDANRMRGAAMSSDLPDSGETVEPSGTVDDCEDAI
jgi:transposase InsO family protein